MPTAIRVLYVDDEPDLLEIGKLFLENSGDFSVTTISSVPAALDLLKKIPFDAIISDYQMPGMDGIQFLVEVRSRVGSVPFILFTGKGREEVVIQAINSGADFYLQKGGDPGAQFAELSHKIKSAVERKSAEKELHESEGRLHSYIDNAPEGVFIADETGRYLEVNPAACRITGYEMDELLMMHIPDLLAPESIQAGAKNFKEVIESGHACSELLFRHKDGSLRHWLVDAVRLSPTRFLGFTKDITKRKLAEATLLKNIEEIHAAYEKLTATDEKMRQNYDDLARSQSSLRESEEKYRTLIQNMQIGMVVHGPDTGILFSNPRAAQILGLTHDQMHGKTAIDPAWCFIREDGTRLPLEEYPVNRVLTSDVPLSNLIMGVLRPDQEGQTWVQCDSHTIRSLDGKLQQIVITFIDITGRKRAEEALVENERQKIAILDGISTNIAFVGKDLKILWVNKFAARSVNKSPTEMAGQTCHAMWADPARPCENCPTLKVFETKQSAHIIQHTPDGRVWDERGEPVFDEHGNLIGVVEIAQDITERKIAEEALITSQALLNTTIDSIPDIIGIQNVDHTMVRYNRAGYEFLHLTPEEVYGRRCYELIGRTIPCEDCATGKALITKKTEQSERYLPEYGIYLDCRSSPVLDKNGEIVLIVEQLRDITERKRAEDALRESKERFRTIIHSMQFGIVIIDAETHTILDANDAALEMIGDSNDDVVGSVCHRFICPAESGRCPVTDLGQDIDSSERILLNLRGEKIPIIKSVIKTTMGGKVVLIESFIDITERKRAEDALVESESFNRDLVENLPEYIMVYRPDGKILYVNPASARVLGYSADELVGTSVLHYVAEEHREEVISMMKARHEGREVPAYEIDIVGQDGHRRSVITKGTPVR